MEDTSSDSRSGNERRESLSTIPGCFVSSLFLPGLSPQTTKLGLTLALFSQYGRDGHVEVEVGEKETSRLPSFDAKWLLDDPLACEGDGSLLWRSVSLPLLTSSPSHSRADLLFVFTALTTIETRSHSIRSFTKTRSFLPSSFRGPLSPLLEANFPSLVLRNPQIRLHPRSSRSMDLAQPQEEEEDGRWKEEA